MYGAGNGPNAISGAFLRGIDHVNSWASSVHDFGTWLRGFDNPAGRLGASIVALDSGVTDVLAHMATGALGLGVALTDTDTQVLMARGLDYVGDNPGRVAGDLWKSYVNPDFRDRGLWAVETLAGLGIGSLATRVGRVAPEFDVSQLDMPNSASAVHAGRLAAESADVSLESILRALRQADTPESLATAKLLSRGKLDLVIRETDPLGEGAGGRYWFGAREVEIYEDAFSTPVGAAGYTTHETVHFMQRLTLSSYNRGHEFSAFRAQGAVDPMHFTNQWTNSQLELWLTQGYKNVPPAPKIGR